MKNLITREEAVAIVGEALVNEAEAQNAEYLNGYDAWTSKYTATASGPAVDGEEVTLSVVFYQKNDVLAACEDFDNLDWVIAGYEIH